MSLVGQPKTNEFTTVFELTAEGIRVRALFHLAVSLVLVIGGIAWFFIRKKKILFGILVVAVGLEWFSEHLDLFNLAVSDIQENTRMAEGVVHVSWVAGYHKPGSGDKLTVGGKTFAVDPHAIAGYKQTIVRGGVLRGGVYARLHHADGVILKVEIKGQPPVQQITVTKMIFLGLAATLCLLVLGAITYIMLTYFRFLRPCLINLRQIAAAKKQWAMANRKTKGEDVVISEVNRYIKSDMTPVCPQGGTYSYNRVGEKPTCSCFHKGPPDAERPHRIHSTQD